MTQAAGKIVGLTEAAVEAGWMWISARSANLVAAHAEHFAGAAMAARARKRVEPRCLAMRIARPRRPRPPRWMWVSAGGVLARNA